MNAKDIREVNILTLRSIADCEILLDEFDHSLGQIEEDIRNKFGDEEWERKARRALSEIEHKGRLVKRKLEALQEEEERRKKGPYPENVRYSIMFHEVAMRILDPIDLETVKKALHT